MKRTSSLYSCLVALSLGALTACSVIAEPDPPVADSTLIDVLIEFHLANARADLGYDLPPALRDSVLAAHHLDRTAFDEAMAYYAERPDAYLSLYNELLDRFSAERAAETDFRPSDLPEATNERPEED